MDRSGTTVLHGVSLGTFHEGIVAVALTPYERITVLKQTIHGVLYPTPIICVERIKAFIVLDTKYSDVDTILENGVDDLVFSAFDINFQEVDFLMSKFFHQRREPCHINRDAVYSFLKVQKGM